MPVRQWIGNWFVVNFCFHLKAYPFSTGCSEEKCHRSEHNSGLDLTRIQTKDLAILDSSHTAGPSGAHHFI